MQVKLLRAIQERRVRKLGTTTEKPVDVRLLSATNQDLSRLVAEGRFRQDLFYRLNVIELRVPSLRDRVEDVPELATAFLAQIAQRSGATMASLSPAALEALCRYPFPGNVRELENILERAVALAQGDELQLDDLMLPWSADPCEQPDATPVATTEPPVVSAGVGQGAATPDADESQGAIPSNLQAYVDSVERDAIYAALEKTHFNRTAAAQLLGVTFRQLRYRMQRLGVR